MIYQETKLAGALHLTIEPASDDRGYFASTFDAEEFAVRGLNPLVAQTAVSINRKKGTLRGLHYRAAPSGEAKLVRCLQGAIFDVVVDLRPGSATYCGWISTELTGRNLEMMYIPEGMAHGYITLTPDTTVGYQISQPYVPSTGRGVRWDDPSLGIAWPAEPLVISLRDRAYPDIAR